MATYRFPEGFLWGVATSAQQIEGGRDEAGRGESIWDRFALTPGAIEDGSNPFTACDHYHRWREDVEHMTWLGIGAYRFSVAWPRILPEGRGAPNSAGLDFYDALVDALLAAGIRPFVTLYHWDLPQPLQDCGGWGTRETAEAFVDFAAAVTARLGDRVRQWATHNEPWCIATQGHEDGSHAPGHKDPGEALRAAHHLLLSHGWAVGEIRRNVPDAQIGIVLNFSPAWPVTGSEADLEAARRFDGLFNRWYLDPLFRGTYPADAVADRIRRGHLETSELPFAKDGDLATIKAPLDFLGVNYYSRTAVKAGPGGDPIAVAMVPREELTDMGWEVFPQGLTEILVRVAREYGPRSIYVTENGAAFPDAVGATGRVADARRTAYLRSHVAAAHRALSAGVPLGGYFAWSLLDNFEWQHGYTKRFGLFRVDFDTGQRTAKDSAYWYRDAIAANAVDDGD
jgi:beta-glucosidase